MKGLKRVLAAACAVGALVVLGGCGGSGASLSDSSGLVPSSDYEETTESVVLPSETTASEPLEPEKPSVLSFLKTALEPVGNTMYIWGGGWNEADTGAGVEAVTLGVSPNWAAFAQKQDSSYNYKNHRYQIHDGLDCSGYVGWAVYNTLETESGKEGYVGKAAQMAQNFAELGLGDYIPAAEITQWMPGDIMSMKGHVWISLGMCEDGSVLLVHSSPPGVILCGTELSNGSESEAVRLARSIMKEHYPDWFNRFPDCSRSYSYLEKSSAMRWDPQVLRDEEHLQSMNAYDAAQLLFGAS